MPEIPKKYIHIHIILKIIYILIPCPFVDTDLLHIFLFLYIYFFLFNNFIAGFSVFQSKWSFRVPQIDPKNLTTFEGSFEGISSELIEGGKRRTNKKKK